MEPTRSDGQAARGGFETGVVLGCPVETSSVRAFLRALDRPRLAWADGRETILAGGEAATITADSTETTVAADGAGTTIAADDATATIPGARGRFTAVREGAATVFEALTQVDRLPHAARPRLFGGFAFTDMHDSTPDGTWAGFPGAYFVLPAVQLSLTPDGPWLTATAVGPGASETARRRLEVWHDRLAALPESLPAPPPGVHRLSYTPGRETWREQVNAALERIHRGDLKKVVLAQSLTATLEEPLSVTDVLARLAEPYPDCYRFLVEPPDGGAFFGATPERLVTVHGDAVETEALAGSIGRGESDEEDAQLAMQLRESEKNVHEHDLVVDAIRDQLEGLTTGIHAGERTVRRLATVQHLQTPIRATLASNADVLSLVEALHPTPAVGGLPPGKALQTIRETEAFDRGWYAAPVGWLDGDGDGTFAVAIRSGIATARTATLFAGAGIVPDSDADSEWNELQLKYRPILDELA